MSDPTAPLSAPPPEPPPPPPGSSPEQSRTPFIVGGAILLAAIIVAIALVVSGGDDDVVLAPEASPSASASEVMATPTPTVTPTPTPTPTAAPTPTPAPAAPTPTPAPATIDPSAVPEVPEASQPPEPAPTATATPAPTAEERPDATAVNARTLAALQQARAAWETRTDTPYVWGHVESGEGMTTPFCVAGVVGQLEAQDSDACPTAAESYAELGVPPRSVDRLFEDIEEVARTGVGVGGRYVEATFDEAGVPQVVTFAGGGIDTTRIETSSFSFG